MSAKAGTERDAVVSTMVYIHESVHKTMQQLAVIRGGRAGYITPRHYLDFIKHYASLFNEKRAQLEDQQRHLTTGLRKLTETQEQVLKLQNELTIKDRELQTKNKLANDKLEQMMVDKQEAENKRDASEQIAREIETQERDIQSRKTKVEDDLSSARPALEEAQAAVNGIKKADLDTVIRFPNPPAAVKLALEPVILMLGETISDWADIRRTLRRADFVKSVVDYDISRLDPKIAKKIVKEYLPNPDFTYDVVYNASKACGPLVKWVQSTINFARIKDSVAPLEQEMKELESKAMEMRHKQAELTAIREELGRRIDQYKKEYSVLISEVEKIKAEMSTVKVKVDRSVNLLQNLSHERSRWEADSASFQSQIATVVGDCLLSAAFLAYIGYFNQNYRQLLLDTWSDRIKQAHVKTKPDLSLIEYLSHPSERLEWASNALPSDDLCIENAIMLKTFNRYPLVIDPSGQATEYMMKQFASRKILRTSFLDDAFLKNLESALRFGNALLVEDVENIDPILNSVLNREITKTGGRVMITLGDKEIDFSPAFTIFLSTRDPSSHFTPDLCSRVTFVNFTVTPSSLTSQCLSRVLKSERRDIDQKRSDLLKLQGEFRVRLRQLEEALLNALNGTKGQILEDDQVMLSLETLKRESSDTLTKMSESDLVMEEINTVSNQYRPFAMACSSVYFTLEKLADVHFLYQFSLPFFLLIVDKILSHDLGGEQDPLKRLSILTRHLYTIAFQRTSRGLLHHDQMAFAVRLAQIALDDTAELMTGASATGETQLSIKELDYIMRARSDNSADDQAADSLQLPASFSLTRGQRRLLAELTKLPGFAKLLHHMNANAAAWNAYLSPSSHEAKTTHEIPTGWEITTIPRLRLFQSIAIAKALRPDDVPARAAAFVTCVFGPTFLSSDQQQLDVIVREESQAHVPWLLISRPGFDASSKVDALATTLPSQSHYQSFAMGSPEGYEQADQAINAACKKGTWVSLKNVHLSPLWLSQLEKRLHRLSPHPNFRLFMTMEIHPKVPTNLLRLSNKIIFEPPVGIKSSLRRMFAQIPASRINKAPAERARLYFLLAWLHAMVLERLRYAPVGWSKPFEFSESDSACAMDVIDEWMDRTAQGRMNVKPSQIPWDALRTTLEQVIYGGRIDNEFDQERLAAFVRALFTAKSYDADFPLASSYANNQLRSLISMPDATNFEQLRAWIDSMEDLQTPEMLGLPSNAELMLLIQQGEHMEQQLLLLQDNQRDHESVAGVDLNDGTLDDLPTSRDSKNDQGRRSSVSTTNVALPPWMIQLHGRVKEWLSRLPQLHAIKAVGNAAFGKPAAQMEILFKNPLFRCVQREYIIWTQLLETVIFDLESLRSVIDGTSKANNSVRELFASLRRDILPPTWSRAHPIRNLSPSSWIDDLARRVEQIRVMVQTAPETYHKIPVWLGGLYSPEGYVAATRQAVAQSHGWSLDSLVLRVTINDTKDRPDSFLFEGLELHSATWSNDALSITSDAMSVSIPHTRFTWIPKAQAAVESLITVPVYLEASRSNLLFSVDLRRPADSVIPASVFTQRSTAITLWSTATAQQ